MLTYPRAAISTLLIMGRQSMTAQAISKQKAEFMETMAMRSTGRRKSAYTRKLTLEFFQADFQGQSKSLSALRKKVIEKLKYIPPSKEERVLQNYGSSNNINGNSNANSKNYYSYNAGANSRNR